MNSSITFSLDPSATPQQNLKDFVVNTGELLESVTNDDDCKYLTEDYAKQEMKEAWKELYSSPSIGLSTSISLVHNYSMQVFHSDTAILKHHGLTENNLKLKFKVLNHLWDEFKDAHNAVVNVKNNADSGISLARSWFDRLLDIINKIFKSLIAAVPGGGALEEYKSVVESLIPTDDSP